MKISAIKQQAKRADRYSIYVDEVYQFSLSESELLISGLHSGQELSEQQLAEYKASSATGKLFDRILNLLSIRPRSKWEVCDYLWRKDASPEQTQYIVERCERLGYLNDEQFARQWVQNRRATKPISQRKLRSELMTKRVDATIIDRILTQDRSETDERDMLRALVAKKQSRYPDDNKFMQYLVRQGFNYEDIKAVLSEQ